MKEVKILSQLAKRIRDLRKNKNLSQEQLAEASDLHPTFIGKIERGEINPSLLTLEKIAMALKLPTSELLHFIDDERIYDENIGILKKALEKASEGIKQAKSIAYSLKTKKK